MKHSLNIISIFSDKTCIRVNALYLSVFLLLLTISSATNASYEYTVINTRQKAETIIKQLKPLFAERAQFSARDYQLLIKASPDVIKEVNYLIKKIDRPLKNLLIQLANKNTINQLLKSDPRSNQANTIGGATDSVKSIYQAGTGNAVITSTKRYSENYNNSIFSVRAIEDSWVTIKTGKQLPYYTAAIPASRYYQDKDLKHDWVQTRYKEVISGFDAKASLNTNNQVEISLIIESHYQDKQYRDTIQTRTAETTISGELDQWIEIGKIENIKKQSSSSTLYTNRLEPESSYFIKVSIANRH